MQIIISLIYWKNRGYDDLHLHPTWQQKIIPDLKKVFPHTQIIANTHSPEVVTTVKQN